MSLDTKDFVCLHCRKCFQKNGSLLRHARIFHKGQPPPENLHKGRKPKITSTGEEFPCHQCGKVFGSKRSVKSHIRSVHRAKDVKKAIKTKITWQTENKEFNSCIEFFQWKIEEEDRTYSRFVKRNGDASHRGGVVVRRYYCHRGGIFKPKGQMRRKMKVQGSCKTGSPCPASMTARIHSNGKVFVSYVSTHVNHSCDLGYLPRRKQNTQSFCDDSLEIAEEVVADVSFPSPCQNEVDAILDGLYKQHSGANSQKNRETALRHLNTIAAALAANINVDDSMCEMLGRTAAYFSAARRNPALPNVPEISSREPAKKKADKRPIFSSARKQNKRRSEHFVIRPMNAEESHLLASLSDSSEVISYSHLNTDHDYDERLLDIAMFEHGYELKHLR